MLSSEELSQVKRGLEDNGPLLQQSLAVADGSGRQSRLCLWNHPGSDVTGMVGRAEKVAGTMEQVSNARNACIALCLFLVFVLQ